MRVRNQRGRKNRDNTMLVVHIDGKDCWSLDHTLAQIIAPALVRLKAESHGFPSDMPSVVRWHQRFEEERNSNWRDGKESKALWKAGAEEWNSILNEMIWTFETLADDELAFEEEVANKERIERGLFLFAKHYRSLWD